MSPQAATSRRRRLNAAPEANRLAKQCSADPDREQEPLCRPVQKPTEFYRWNIVDERTGKRRLTTYATTRADAVCCLGAEPDLQSRETRTIWILKNRAATRGRRLQG